MLQACWIAGNMLHVRLSMLNAVRAQIRRPQADVAEPDHGMDSRRLSRMRLWTLTRQPNAKAPVSIAKSLLGSLCWDLAFAGKTRTEPQLVLQCQVEAPES